MRRPLSSLVAAALAVTVTAAAQQPPVAPGETAQAVYLTAERQEELLDENLWRGSGGVELRYQDVTIRCEEMEFDRDTMELVARGGVVMDRGPSRFTCAELHYNLREKTGVFYDAAGDIEPFYSFTAGILERLDETNYRLEDATFTACEPAARPPWRFDIQRARIEQEGYGRFNHVAFRVKGAPVFYLPYLVWPVKRERTAGLLMPTFGYSDLRGTYLGTSVYLPLGRSLDTTLFLDWFSEGYYGIGSEWRWAPAADAAGQVNLYTVWDPLADTWQWKVDGRHEQDDLLGFRLLAEVEDLSDVDFFQEFERDFNANTRRSLYSYAYLSRSRGTSTLNLRADRRVTFLEPEDVTLSQLPELELRVRPTRIGRSDLYWNMISSVNVFTVDRGGELDTTYARADLFPEISYTLPGPLWLSVTPRLGARSTWYTEQLSPDRQRYVDEPIDRSYLEAGVDIVGPSFSRVFDRPLGDFSRFKHLVEPRFEYSFVSDVEDQSLIPTFDEVDSTLVINKVRVTLANRLFARSREGVSAQELASFDLFQEYSFDEPLNRGDGIQTSQRGPLGASLRVTPSPGLTFDSRVSYDTLFDELTSSSVSASVYRGWFQSNFSWYASWSPQTGERTSSQVRAMLGYRQEGVPLSATVQLSYDVERAELLQQQYRLGYEGSCWGVTMEYRDLQIGLFPTRDWRVMISLKGVGALPEIRGTLGGI